MLRTCAARARGSHATGRRFTYSNTVTPWPRRGPAHRAQGGAEPSARSGKARCLRERCCQCRAASHDAAGRAYDAASRRPAIWARDPAVSFTARRYEAFEPPSIKNSFEAAQEFGRARGDPAQVQISWRSRPQGLAGRRTCGVGQGRWVASTRRLLPTRQNLALCEARRDLRMLAP